MDGIHIYERCQTGNSISIGGSSDVSGLLAFTKDEMGAFYASKLKITSLRGSVNIFDFDHDVQMNSVTGRVTIETLKSGKDITVSGVAKFKSLLLFSNGAIKLDENLFTTVGAMDLTFNGGNMELSAGKMTSSKSTQTISKGVGSGKISIITHTTTTKIKSEANFYTDATADIGNTN
jgi:hypothetical protein